MNAAILGMGKYAERLVSAVQGKSRKIRFTAGATRHPSSGEAFASRHNIALATDYDVLLANHNIDAVVIATPHSMHALHVAKAARAGKHVFVEKPFTLTRESAEESCRICSEQGVILAVGFNSRFRPALLELKKELDSGGLGKIIHVEGQISGYPGNVASREQGHWRTVRNENPAGGMTGKGIHLVDQMLWLCGSIASVYARSERRVIDLDIDDVTTMLFRFKSGVSGYLGTLLSTPNYWRLQVFGSTGWAEVRDEERITVQQRGMPIRSHIFEPIDTRLAELEAFADAINGLAPYPVSMKEAIDGSSVLEAIETSAHEKREVQLPGHEFSGPCEG